MKTIRISDVGTTAIVVLTGTRLRVTASGGCPVLDILRGARLRETMPDAEIERRIYRAWSRGYDGDPAKNELAVRVTPGAGLPTTKGDDMNTQQWLTNNCDGSGPHSGPDQVRVFPLGGGGNLILCLACWARENRYRYERGRETGAPENWPQENFHSAKIYAQGTA